MPTYLCWLLDGSTEAFSAIAMATESTSAPCGAGAVGWAGSGPECVDDGFIDCSSLSTLPNCLLPGATGWVWGCEVGALEPSAGVADGLLDALG